MALVKTFEVRDSGINAEYVKISNINLVKSGDVITLNITCEVFKDQAARDAGKNPISVLSYNTQDPAILDSISTEVYNLLKTLPDFTGAVDV